MNAIECIGTRRSVREYKNIPVDEETLNTIITAAICAPSGKNGQPWRFKIVMDKELINEVSQLSVYYSWMRTAAVLVLVFLDHLHSFEFCVATPFYQRFRNMSILLPELFEFAKNIIPYRSAPSGSMLGKRIRL